LNRIVRALFVGCVVVMAVVILGSLFGGIYWRYARSSVGYQLLPGLGFALALGCILGRSLPTVFRIVAGIVAAASVVYGFVAPILEAAY